jgi:hypothetical protein
MMERNSKHSSLRLPINYLHINQTSKNKETKQDKTKQLPSHHKGLPQQHEEERRILIRLDVRTCLVAYTVRRSYMYNEDDRDDTQENPLFSDDDFTLFATGIGQHFY